MVNFLSKLFKNFKRSDSSGTSLEELEQNIVALELYIKGIERLKDGSNSEALELFNSALGNGLKGQPTIFRNRGNCYQRMDRHPLAIRDFTEYIKACPKEWDGYNLRSLSFMEMDEFKSQILDLNSVRKILGSKRKRNEEEESVFDNLEYEGKKAAINLEYHDELARINGEFEDTLESARKSNPNYSKFNPASIVPKRLYSSTYLKAVKKGLDFDQKDERTLALEYYDYAIQHNSTDVRAFALRAFCLQSHEFYLDAIDDFNRAIELTPDDPNLHFGLGNSFYSIKKYDIAVLHGERAIFFAKRASPLYEAYNEEAKVRGFKDAGAFYESMIWIWKVSKESKSEDVFNSIRYNDASTNDYLVERRRKMDIEMELLLKRRAI